MESMLIERFGKPKLTVGEYARMEQGALKTTSSFIQRMEDLGEEIEINPKDRRSIIGQGIRNDRNVIRLHIIESGLITQDLIRKIEQMEIFENSSLQAKRREDKIRQDNIGEKRILRGEERREKGEGMSEDKTREDTQRRKQKRI